MPKIDDGVVKYSLKFEKKKIQNEALCFKIENIRRRLYAMQLIGAYTNGIGYGNISHRDKETDSFYITGTQTGELADLEIKDYSFVKSVDFQTFKTVASGLSQPSSESITHAAIYALDPDINAVIHIHNERLWNFMLENDYLSTNDTPYGTPEMIEDIQTMYKKLTPLKNNAFVMAGHFEGIVTFGRTLDEAQIALYKLVGKCL